MPSKKNILFLSFFWLSCCDAENIELVTQNIPEIRHDISLPLREMTGIQSTTSPSLTSKPIQTKVAGIPFSALRGIGKGLDDYQVHSPYSDANGSVGTTQYVQAVNTDIAIFNKNTGAILPGFPVPGNTLWKNFGGVCEAYSDGSPIVKFDQLANRWVITQLAFDDLYNGPFMQCIAVSTSDDATGSYYRYAFQFDSINRDGKLGMWPDAYYLSFRMDGPITYHPLICAVERSRMLMGQAARMKCRVTPLRLMPVDLEGTSLPLNQTPAYAVGVGNVDRDFNKLQLFKFYVNFDNSKLTYLEDPTLFDGLGNGGGRARQPGGIILDIPGDVMHRSTYRQFADHGSLLASQSVAYFNGPFIYQGIGWYELRFKNDGSIEPYQQEIHKPNGFDRYVPSIAMDKAGNIAVGYNVSTSLIYPSIELAWRYSTDPINTLSHVQALVTGHGSQTVIHDWGKYSSMSLDPIDGCTFWYTNQYLENTGNFNWSTAIINFKIPTCN